MSKQNLGVAVSALATVCSMLFPGISDNYRLPSFLVSAALLVVFCVWYWLAPRLANGNGVNASAKHVCGDVIIAGRDVHQTHYHSAPTPAKSDALLTAQLQELHQLQDFIAGKSESELWELFDLAGITRFNIKRAKEAINALSSSEASESNEFFKDGQAILDTRYCRVDRTAGGFHYEPIPGKMGILNLSAKFVSNRRILAKFQDSPQLPIAVKDAIKQLDSAVHQNAQTLLDEINRQLAEHPENVLSDDNGQSPLFGAVSGAFLKKRVWLKPKQEAILSAIENYLNAQ